MIRKSAASLLLCLLLVSPAWCQVKAVITGPDKAAQGDLIILDASGSTGATVRHWLLIASQKAFLPVDGGQRVVFASGQNGAYRFVLVCAGDNGSGGLAVDVAEHVVTVGDGAPDPDIDPVVPVTLPKGKYDLANWALQNVKKNSALKPSPSHRLADSFDKIATQINPPDPNLTGIKTVEELLQKSAASHIEALGPDRQAWSGLSSDLQVKLEELNDGGEMSSLEDHQTAWRELATGFRAVR